MNPEIFFNKLPKKKKKEEESIRGDNFVIIRGKGSRSSGGYYSLYNTSVEFRSGASNEEKIKAAEEARKKEIERTKNFTEADFAVERARQNRNWIAEWLKDGIKKSGEYSETLKIKQDGSLDREKRMDGRVPFIVSIGDLKSLEDLYQLMHKISQEHPDLNMSFEVDPNREWMKYTVLKTESKK